MTNASAERRKRPRRRTLMAGTVRFAAQTGTVSCVVRNLTAGGARLDVDNAFWLPDRFDVEIARHNLCAPASVIWRGGSALGIRFEAAVRVFGEEAAPEAGEAGALAMQAQRDRARLAFLEQERARMVDRIRRLTDEY